MQTIQEHSNNTNSQNGWRQYRSIQYRQSKRMETNNADNTVAFNKVAVTTDADKPCKQYRSIQYRQSKRMETNSADNTGAFNTVAVKTDAHRQCKSSKNAAKKSTYNMGKKHENTLASAPNNARRPPRTKASGCCRRRRVV